MKIKVKKKNNIPNRLMDLAVVLDHGSYWLNQSINQSIAIKLIVLAQSISSKYKNIRKKLFFEICSPVVQSNIMITHSLLLLFC